MAWPLFPKIAKRKPDQIVAVDLGSRVTKVVHMQRCADKFTLLGYALLDAPISDKGSLPVNLLGEHLRLAVQAVSARTKTIALAIGAADCLVRHVEMPEMPQDAVRQVLKNNPRNYLQQDLANYVFDCHIIYQAVPVGLPNPAKKGPVGHVQRLLVSGTKRQFLDDLISTGKDVGVNLTHVIPGLICPANAFESALPEVFKNEVVALVEIGFKSSSVFILQQGELVLTRVVNIGGDRLTIAIAEELKISYAEADGIKVGMPSEIQTTIEAFTTALARELRASLDYFEHQQDKMVSRIYVSGGSARSELFMQIFQSELMTNCVTWNPLANLHMELPPVQKAEVDQVGSQLGVAVGAAIAAL